MLGWVACGVADDKVTA